MKEMFEKHEERFTPAEDRAVWDVLVNRLQSSRRVPSRLALLAPVGALILGIAIWGVSQRTRKATPGFDHRVPNTFTEHLPNTVGPTLPGSIPPPTSVSKPGRRLNDSKAPPGSLVPKSHPEGRKYTVHEGHMAAGDAVPSIPDLADAHLPRDEGAVGGDKSQLEVRTAQPIPLPGGLPSMELRAIPYISGGAQPAKEDPNGHHMSGKTNVQLGLTLPRLGSILQTWERVGSEFRSDSPHPISVGGTDPVNGQAFDAMFFEHYGVNPFIDPEEDRFATFAVDVDNASYTMMRAYLDRGELPPKEAVRVEEFINAFDHDYAPPAPGLTASRDVGPSEKGTFAVHLEAAPSPFGKGLTLLRVGLKGREVDTEDRNPAVLTFVVDVSGSMAREDRLELVKKALTLLLEQMHDEDEVGLVVYGSDSRTVLPHTSLRHRRSIEQAIAELQPEGSTNAEAGLVEGYRLADEGYRKGRLNRVILCSDGVANVGRTGADDILDRIRLEARRGIELSAVGFGMGNYNDVLMEKLADRGDGNYYYVDDLDEARRVFVENLTGTLQTIARQVKIQVEFDPDAVKRYRLLGYENRDVADRDFRNDRIDAGEVGAGHEVTALFEIKTMAAHDVDSLATVRIRYEDPETGRVTEEARLIRAGDVREGIEDAVPSFRLDAAVAEFAEILRRSYWAREGDLGRVASLVRGVNGVRERPETEELLRLVNRAEELWPKNEAPMWRDDDVRPRWEPGGEPDPGDGRR